DVFLSAEPVLQCYAKCVRLLGPSGSGQLAKMVNQICIAGVVQGLSEALLFSERAGLDSAAVVEVISQGAAQSWQMDNRYRTMLDGEYEHGFAVDWMRKDLAMVLDEAARLGLELPLTALVDGFYADVQSMGGGRWDTSSLFARMRERQG
ncbi:MAG: NAD(P)-dependent oxidoreductase, partial [Halioglobus sp.]|nr:NAD(P)-dependent oxidoreductase [Halioglobus sp.]